MANEQSSLPSDNSFIRVPTMDDDLDLQIALDELAAGSDVALKHFLARKAGVDPSTVSLRKRSFHASENEGSTCSFLGKLDSVNPADAGNDLLSPPDSSRKYIHFLGDEEDPPYQYIPLSDSTQQVRLLRLGECGNTEVEPRVHDHLTVGTFDLDTAPDYFCLSYVWGSPERFIPVNCNGGTLLVTQNLFHALKNIFTRYPSCYLWADGLCINQDDLEERARQVRLMGQIYTRSKMVLAQPGHFRYTRASTGDELAADRDAPSTNVGHCSTSDQITEKSLTALNELHLGDSTTTPPEQNSVNNQTAEEYKDMSQARSAISLMNFIARIWSKQGDYEVVPDSEWQKYPLPAIEGEDSKIWDNLLSFWQEDWLWRTWVLPECVLAPKVVVMYGDYVVSLDAMMEFWDAARKRGLPKVLRHGVLTDIFSKIMHLTPVTTFMALRGKRVSPEDIKALNEKTNQDTAEEGNSTRTLNGMKGSTAAQAVNSHIWKDVPDMLELLALCRNNRATDDRDKVYALLGLADDNISRAVQPSYLKTNTPAQTFIDVGRQYVRAGRGAELLEHAGSHHNIGGLYSWTPDWTHQSRSRLRTKLYNTTRGMVGSIVINGSDHLQLRGTVLSPVKLAGLAWRYYSSGAGQQPFMPIKSQSGELIEIPPFPDEDARCAIRALALQLIADPDPTTSKLYPDGLEQAVARTLCADCSWSGGRLSSSDTALQDFVKSFEAFQKFYAQGPDPEQSHLKPESQLRVHKSGIFHWLLDFDEQEEERLMKELWPFAMAMQEVMRGRRFAVLESGHLAVLPWDAERGDLVVVLEGARVPFVVRKIESEEVHFENRDTKQTRIVELVGDCYVHGVMDGELEMNAQVNEVNPTALNSQGSWMAWEEMVIC